MAKQRVFFFLILLLALIWVFPFYTTVTVSFKTLGEIQSSKPWSTPKQLYWGNFKAAFNLRLLSQLKNSFIIAAVSVIGTLFLSSLAGYALATYSFKLNTFILMVFLGFNFMPTQIYLIPLFRLCNLLRIYDTLIAVILFHVAFQTGFSSFFLRNFMRTIPSEIKDAGRMDGLSEFGIFWRLILPLSVMPLSSLGVLLFTWIWNDYLVSAVLIKSDTIKPITVALASLRGQYIVPYGLQNAVALLSFIPTIAIFIIFQRYFLQGLTAGAMK